MISEIIMPKMSNTMTEGTIIGWLKKEGEFVNKGEILFEIMTDKINMEVEALESGILKKIIYDASDVPIKIGTVIGIVGDEDDEIPEKYLVNNIVENKEYEFMETKGQIKDAKLRKLKSKNNGKNLKISPKAKKLAKECGIDLTSIEITNKNGIIKEKDILKIKEMIGSVKTTSITKKVVSKNGLNISKMNGARNIKIEEGEEGEYKIVPITGVRRIIADRMSVSKFSAPHIYFFKEINMEKAINYRRVTKNRLEKDGGTITITSIIAYAVVRSLAKYPEINSCIKDNNMLIYKNINIGIAVDTDRGLLVPVIKDANKKGLQELSIEISNTIKATRENKLLPEKLNGGTFTISNLGPFDSDSFTAIINNPQVAILAVSSVKKRPVVVEGKIVIKPIMNVTLSVDHRVIDGLLSTKFLNKIKYYLENPELFSL